MVTIPEGPCELALLSVLEVAGFRDLSLHCNFPTCVSLGAKGLASVFPPFAEGWDLGIAIGKVVSDPLNFWTENALIRSNTDAFMVVGIDGELADASLLKTVGLCLTRSGCLLGGAAVMIRFAVNLWTVLYNCSGVLTNCSGLTNPLSKASKVR